MSAKSLAELPRFLPCPTGWCDPAPDVTIPNTAPDPAGKAIVHKTGLGSSAALVTSLTAALFQALCFTTLPTAAESRGVQVTEDERGPAFPKPTWEAMDRNTSVRFVHNVAQVAHGLAQGKVCCALWPCVQLPTDRGISCRLAVDLMYAQPYLDLSATCESPPSHCNV